MMIFVIAYVAIGIPFAVIARRISATATYEDVSDRLTAREFQNSKQAPLIVDVITGLLWPIPVLVVLVELVLALIRGWFKER